MNISFQKIDKALHQLKEATTKQTVSDLERDGVIQRFEYTIELLWKISKKVLQENRIIVVAPKEVIRELANIGWIHNPDKFLNFIKMRNETSHSYEEDCAVKVYEASKQFTSECEKLVNLLKEKAK